MFRSLEELLLETGMATQEQINEARKSGKGSNIAEALTEIGVLTQQHRNNGIQPVPHVTLDNYQLKPVLKILDPELVRDTRPFHDKSGDA